MSQLGTGVMIQMLFGNSFNYTPYVGKKITDAEVKDDALYLTFEGTDKKLKIEDGGQSCCENRYMTTDDDPKSLIGGNLRAIEEREGEDVKDPCYRCEGRGTDLDGEECVSCSGSKVCSWSDHETAFVIVSTDQTSITLCTHNEHNGYYGGFALRVEEV